MDREVIGAEATQLILATGGQRIQAVDRREVVGHIQRSLEAVTQDLDEAVRSNNREKVRLNVTDDIVGIGRVEVHDKARARHANEVAGDFPVALQP